MQTTCKVWAASMLGIILLPALIVPAESHHSYAMYDQTVRITMTGRLVRFIIGANHSQFVFQPVEADGSLVVDDDGQAVTWNVETGPVTTLARQGITVDSFPIGTIFSVTLMPLRDGRTGGALRGDLILCGPTLPEGGCTAETGEVF